MDAVVSPNRLPFELLEQIFLTVQDHADLTSVADIDRANYDWLNITAVCRQWHAVAEACPLLWATIIIPDVPSSAFLQRTLRLSNSAPLAVMFHDSETDAMRYSVDQRYDMLEVVLAELRRIETLSVQFRDRQAYERVFLSLPRSAPILRKYRLQADIIDHEEPFEHPYLDGQLMPVLQEVELLGDCVPWPQLSTITGVRKLRLGLSHYGQSILGSDVLHCLEHLPSIEILDLDMVDLHPDIYGLSQCQKVHLNRLKVLKILTVTSRQCELMLSMLLTPPETTFTITYDRVTRDTKPHLVDSIVYKLSDATSTSFLEPLSGLYIRRRGKPTLAGGRFPTILSAGTKWWSVDEFPGRAFLLNLPTGSKPSIIDLLLALPTEDVRQVWLDIEPNHLVYKLPRGANINMLLPSVTDLHILESTSFSSLEALGDTIDLLSKRIETRDPNSYAWPHVTTLTIHSGYGKTLTSESLEKLRVVLEQRQARGCARLLQFSLVTLFPLSGSEVLQLASCADQVTYVLEHPDYFSE